MILIKKYNILNDYIKICSKFVHDLGKMSKNIIKKLTNKRALEDFVESGKGAKIELLYEIFDKLLTKGNFML